jgi:hypothetical protein
MEGKDHVCRTLFKGGIWSIPLQWNQLISFTMKYAVEESAENAYDRVDSSSCEGQERLPFWGAVSRDVI